MWIKFQAKDESESHIHYRRQCNEYAVATAAPSVVFHPSAVDKDDRYIMKVVIVCVCVYMCVCVCKYVYVCMGVYMCECRCMRVRM